MRAANGSGTVACDRDDPDRLARFQHTQTTSSFLGAFQSGQASSIGLFYAVALPLLTLALIGGMPIWIAYGVWAASGVALTALGARILFSDPMTRLTAIGIGLIGIGSS
ncbi:Small Multidrug Resistance protein [Microbacterium sp. cf046]|nr:Small Multidrug Resistance protein [Microbacterium sp. cf046]